MTWDEERSRRRVKDNDFNNFEVDVQDLRRAMDFRNLGSIVDPGFWTSR